MTAPLQAGQILLGLIKQGHPAGVSKGGATWDLVFHLAAWRTRDGEVDRGRLRCLMPVGDKSALQTWYPTVPGLGLVQFEVVRQEGPTLWVRHVSILDGDFELEAVRRQLREPVIVDDVELGRLTLDRRLDVYQGTVQWNGHSISVMLSGADPEQPQAVLDEAKSLLREQAAWDTLAREVAVAKLLPLKNSAWLQEGEDEITSEVFALRMTLNTIDVSEGGEWSLFFDDDDMFGGHAIVVNGHLASKEIEANIAG